MNFAEKALEAEQAIIGSALTDGSWLVNADITADDFLNEKNKIAFSAVWAVHSRNEPVDIVTVNQELESQGYSNWVVYLSEVMRATPSAANALAYVKALKRHSVKHRASQILAGGIQALNDKDWTPDELISALMALNTTNKNHDKTTQQMMSEAIEQIEARREGKIKTLSTGIDLLDQYLGGLHNSDLVVIAGRPAMGKTAVMLNIALNTRSKVGLISSEQGAAQVGERLLAIDGGVSIEKIRQNRLQQPDWDNIGKSGARLISQANFLINDHPSPDIGLIQSQARKWKHQQNIAALFIDYTQRIRASNLKAPKHEQVGEVVKAFKSLARELEIPVIALAQVSRVVETRPCKEPGMGDISDSSEIEKEADQILTLYRDEVYNENSEDKGIIKISVKKNRHGSTNFVRAGWFSDFMQVRNITTGEGYARD